MLNKGEYTAFAQKVSGDNKLQEFIKTMNYDENTGKIYITSDIVLRPNNSSEGRRIRETQRSLMTIYNECTPKKANNFSNTGIELKLPTPNKKFYEQLKSGKDQSWRQK